MEYLLEEGAALREWVLQSNPALAEGFGLIYPKGRTVALPYHYETVKNRDEKRHSTGDESLTEEGDRQARQSALRVGRIALSRTDLLPRGYFPVRIYTSEDPRCLNSAERFSYYLERLRSERVSVLPIQVLPGLNRMGFGRLEGLTDKEIAERDPIFASETRLWLDGKRDRPPFPKEEHGAEDPYKFWKRIYMAASVIISECDGTAVTFGTTSSGSALAARYAMRGPEDLADDGIPYRIPPRNGRRDEVDLFSLNERGYIQPSEERMYPSTNPNTQGTILH